MTLINAQGPDRKVGGSITDTLPGSLIQKLVAGTNIVLTLLNPGGDEKIEISSTTGGEDPDVVGLHYVRCRVENGCTIYEEVNPLFDQTPCFMKKVSC